MTTTELIKILQDNEKGGISHKPRNISLFINGRYMSNPQISLSSTGDGICGSEIDLDIEGEWFEQQPNRCDSCTHSEEQDGSNCYECVKGMADNFEPQPKTGYISIDVNKLAKEVAEKVLDEITYNGKTIREWAEIIVKQQPSEDCISRQAVIILIDEASEMHPYKVVGDSDTYSNYNQGWSDACDWLYANIEGVPSVIPQIQPNSNEFFNFDAPMVKKSDAVSREAVIKNIKGWFDKIELNPDILIDSIVTLPSVTPSYNSIKTELKPCEDCISRQAVDDAIYDYSRSCDVNYEQIMEFIDKLPSVTPKYTDEEIDKAQAVEQAYVDKMVELAVKESRREWLNSFDTNSATKCFEAVNLLKQRLEGEE